MNTVASRILAATVSVLLLFPLAISFSGTANAGFFFPSFVPGVEQLDDTLDINVVNWGPQTVPDTGSWFFVSSPIPTGSSLTLKILDFTADTTTDEPTQTTGGLSFTLPDGDSVILQLAVVGFPFTMAFELSNVPGALPDPSASATPLPATLPLFAGGLGFLGYLARRKKRGTSPLAIA
jgi:hypothetical protein